MVELYPYAPPDGTELLIAWLQPLGRTSTERRTADPLPFRTVRRIGGPDDGLTDKGLYAVHCITQTEEQAYTEGALTHRRLELLSPPWGAPAPVTTSTGVHYADDLECTDTNVIDWSGDRTEWAWVGVYRLVTRVMQAPA